MSKIPKGNPYAGIAPHGDPSDYSRSLIPPEPKIRIDLDDPSDRALRSIFFNPDRDTSARVIQAMMHPDSSLAGIARDHATTLEALSTWMARPDIAQRIHHMKHAGAVHHSLAATFQLKHAVNALVIILQEYSDAACHAEGLKSGRGYSPDEHNRRDRETARKACHLLARLANFDQTIRPPRNPRENIRTPDTIPTALPTTNGSTAKGFATIDPDLSGPVPCAAGSPRSSAATGTNTPDAEDIDPEALLVEIKSVLSAVGAPPIQNPRGNAGATEATQPTAPTPISSESTTPSEISNLKFGIPPPAPPTRCAKPCTTCKSSHRPHESHGSSRSYPCAAPTQRARDPTAA
jgi:hypothetical protein